MRHRLMEQCKRLLGDTIIEGLTLLTSGNIFAKSGCTPNTIIYKPRRTSFMTFNLTLVRNYEIEDVWFPFSESILEWDIDFYQLMLNDEIRMTAYKNAIQEVVKPGMVVLDLGTGTGILGLWALQAGAKHLYAIDINSEILSIAVQTFEQGNFSGKYEVLNGISYDINIPTKVDLIISEIMGNIADNEDLSQF
jgi:protein arginine N-methyltransferase 1